jgi:DNA replication and repair protein RecF
VGAGRASLGARFASPGAPPFTAKVQLDRARPRKTLLDDKRPPSSAAWWARIQMVLFHPGDVALPTGAPEARRAFLDRILEQVDPGHVRSLQAYQKALRSRNRLLKADPPDGAAVRAYDAVLAQHGAVVGQGRARLVDELTPRAEALFGRVVGEEVPLRIAYHPRVEPSVEAIGAALEAAYRKDLARGFTADGPHGDDLALEVRGRGAKHHASQGQHRLMVLALKLAELEALAARTGRTPPLLLDDVTSELDKERNRRLFEIIAELGGQVFLTTTHREFVRLADGRNDLTVRRGEVLSASV